MENCLGFHITHTDAKNRFHINAGLVLNFALEKCYFHICDNFRLIIVGAEKIVTTLTETANEPFSIHSANKIRTASVVEHIVVSFSKCFELYKASIFYFSFCRRNSVDKT